jgi:DNA invertase Pin-like site-specific DNA recombinase
LERSLIVERVRAGMRRATLEGRHIGRKALVLDRAAIHRDRQQGHSLGQLAKAHLVSRTTILRVLGEQIPAVTKGLENPPRKPHRISAGSHRSRCSLICGLRNR